MGLAFLAKGFAITAAAAAAAAAIAVARDSADPWPHDLQVTLKAELGGEWRLDYDLAMPARRIDLGPSLNGFRARDWHVVSKDLVIAEEDGRDWLQTRAAGGRFEKASIIVTPSANGFAKQYEPVKKLKGGGAILYTGHFWPYTEGGARYDAAFDIVALPSGHVSAFGFEAAAFDGWISPTRHPAFVYVGPLRPVDIGGVNAVMDGSLPGWVTEESLVLTPRLVAFYAHSFGRGLAGRPDMFLTMGDESEEGVLRYDGDALPGQFHVALSGGAWREPTDEGRLLVRLAAGHELAHLWQERARPASENVPDWIHEGAADALALEALAAIGAIAPEALSERLDAARAECGRVLLGGSLLQAERAGEWRAAYACGHVLAVIAARTTGPDGTVAAFWRDFVQRSAANGGYDERLLFAMVAERGGPEFGRAFALFPRTPYAAPEKELQRLLDAAAAAPAAPGTAPLEGSGGG